MHDDVFQLNICFSTPPYSEVLLKYTSYRGFVNQVFVCECLFLYVLV